MKRYANFAFLYAIFAMVGGVFYREFTKMTGFTGKTTLSVVHTHYFTLGMIFCLLLVVLEKSLSLSQTQQKKMNLFWTSYTIGLNTTVVLLIVRGVFQVLATPLSRGANAAISGIAGLGHAILGLSIIFLLLAVKKEAANPKQ